MAETSSRCSRAEVFASAGERTARQKSNRTSAKQAGNEGCHGPDANGRVECDSVASPSTAMTRHAENELRGISTAPFSHVIRIRSASVAVRESLSSTSHSAARSRRVQSDSTPSIPSSE